MDSNPTSHGAGARWAALLRARIEHPGNPAILAVVNVSPESFYRGSVAEGASAAAEAAQRAVAEGADAVDVGARSTAPYKETAISTDEEAARMGAAVRAIRAVLPDVPLSADTTLSEVAAVAVAAGADAINDVSGLRADPAMGALAASLGAPLLLMVREEEGDGAYPGGPTDAVIGLLRAARRRAIEAGVAAGLIALDPGIGFFRRQLVPWHAWDCEVLGRIGEIRTAFAGTPVVVGASRKSFMGPVLGRKQPEERLAGSLAAAVWAALGGAAMIRVHDVAASRDALALVRRLREEAGGGLRGLAEGEDGGV